jgi:5-methylcytosine-specific restriction endonuclease McrA
MSQSKKMIREKFRTEVFKRDNFTCKGCLTKTSQLDAHHITDRTLMPNGGYVKENGISLCSICHIKAEAYHITGQSIPGYSPGDLYQKIQSSFRIAYSKSLLL